MESFIEATNAAVGTAVSKLATYPLDIVKTRLALAEAGTSLASVVADLTKEKGVVGLYFGVENKLLKSCTAKFIYFYIYRALLGIVESSNGRISVATNLVIGYLGEFLSLPVVMPLEAVVSKSQSSGLTGPQAVRAMYLEGGVRRFYAAPFAYIMGCCQPAIQYTMFDQVKRAFLAANAGVASAAKRTGELTAFQAFALGAVSNAIATTICYPLEVIRMTQQSQGEQEEDTGGESKGSPSSSALCTEKRDVSVAAAFNAMRRHAIAAWAVLRNILKKEGIAGWFKGLGPQLTASVFSAALMMMVKERIVGVSTAVLYLLLTGRAAPQK
eukprot:g5281.t1